MRDVARTPPAATGTLVIRAWVEDGAAPDVRARLTASLGLKPGHEHVTTCAGIDGVSQAVQAWLRELLGEARTPGGGSRPVGR